MVQPLVALISSPCFTISWADTLLRVIPNNSFFDFSICFSDIYIYMLWQSIWHTGFFNKKQPSSYMLSHHTDPAAPPWSMLLPSACRHPNRNGCFFWRPFQAKRCNNIELGERGHASFFAMSVTGWLVFLKNPDMSWHIISHIFWQSIWHLSGILFRILSDIFKRHSSGILFRSGAAACELRIGLGSIFRNKTANMKHLICLNLRMLDGFFDWNQANILLHLKILKRFEF